MDIQATKIELMRMILGIENPSVIERISAIIKDETSDWWDELSDSQKEDFRRAKEDIEEGRTISLNEFIEKIS